MLSALTVRGKLGPCACLREFGARFLQKWGFGVCNAFWSFTFWEFPMRSVSFFPPAFFKPKTHVSKAR